MAFKPKSQPAPVLKFAPSGHSGERVDGKTVWTNVPPPLAMVQSGQIKWRPIWCAGFELDEQGKKHYHHLECIPCHCPPGPQKLMQWSTAREIALCGTRGSAKSEGTFEFLSTGNVPLDYDSRTIGYDPSNPSPTDISYLNNPDYTFLVLRKNSKDLVNYFRRASRYFAHFGGVPTQEPMGVRFPSGAYGIFDHLADEDSYEKQVGAEYTRIVLEEANQIPDEQRYIKISASCRTSNPQMRAQIMLTYNPGGPGARWLKARFIMPGGRRLPFGKAYMDPFSEQRRIAIFSSVEDNPYALASGYDKVLDALRAGDPTLYRQWRLGDFDVQQGSYFDMFRLAPQGDEPKEACHVVAPHKLPAEWPVAIGVDWGFSHPSAVYWGKWSPRKQLHVYREFVVSRMGARDLGVEIARRSLDDLAESPNPSFNLWLSHDAFHRENEGATEAELIRDGVEAVLGKDSAFIFDRSEEEKLLDRDVSWKEVEKRASQRRLKTNITIINAGLKRRGNMNRIRDYMRFLPLATDVMEFNPDVYANLMRVEGELSAQSYVKKCEKPAAEALPVLQIHYDADVPDSRNRGCEKLVVAIQGMIEKPSDTEQMEKQDGDDPVDSLAYLVGNFKFGVGYVSDEEQVRRKIQAVRDKMPNIDMNALIRQAERIESQHKKSKSGGGFSVSRVVAPLRHRMRSAGVR